MRRLLLALVVIAATTGSLAAQESTFRYANDPFDEEDATLRESPQSGSEAPSPSDEYRSYYDSADAKDLVHKNAMFRADQRRRRLEARKWFGLSNLRPTAAAGPYMTPYSPAWAAGPWMPYSWYGIYWR